MQIRYCSLRSHTLQASRHIPHPIHAESLHTTRRYVSISRHRAFFSSDKDVDAVALNDGNSTEGLLSCRSDLLDVIRLRQKKKEM